MQNMTPKRGGGEAGLPSTDNSFSLMSHLSLLADEKTDERAVNAQVSGYLVL